MRPDIDQLVAQGRENDPVDEAAALRGIERVRVLLDADAQVGGVDDADAQDPGGREQ